MTMPIFKQPSAEMHSLFAKYQILFSIEGILLITFGQVLYQSVILCGFKRIKEGFC